MAPFFGGMPLVQSTRHGLGDPTVARWSRKAPPPTDIGLCDPRHSVSRERGIALRDCPRHELHIFKRATYFQEGVDVMPISNSGQQILSRATCGNESSPGAYLPVYEVAGTGIEEEQAKRLAKALEVPLDKIFFRDGIIHFVDPVEYLAVPTVPKVDNKTVATLRAATTNHHPEIPIVVRAIDHAALQRLKALDPDEAFKLTSAALDSAGLTPEHATPVVS